jgi:hypothetical protein
MGPLQLARALLELREAALRDEGDDERGDRRQDEHGRQEEEDGLRHAILMRDSTLFLGKVFVVDFAAEEERIAAGPAAIAPRTDPVGTVEAERLAADRAPGQLGRLADSLTALAEVAPGARSFVEEGHAEIIVPKICYHPRLCGRRVAM